MAACWSGHAVCHLAQGKGPADCAPEPWHRELVYPQNVETSLKKLSTSHQECINFLEKLYGADGTALFHQYGSGARRTVHQAIKGLAWKLVLPLEIVHALLAKTQWTAHLRQNEWGQQGHKYWLDVPTAVANVTYRAAVDSQERKKTKTAHQSASSATARMVALIPHGRTAGDVTAVYRIGDIALTMEEAHARMEILYRNSEQHYAATFWDELG